jgi:hypothetical protein
VTPHTDAATTTPVRSPGSCIHTFIRSHIPTAPPARCNRIAGASLDQCS